MSFFKNTIKENIINKLYILTEQLLYSLTTFLLSILLARNLSPDQFGIWVMLLTLYYLVISINNSSLWQLYIVNINKIQSYCKKIVYKNTVYLLTLIISLFLSFVIAFVLKIKFNISNSLFVEFYLFIIFAINYEIYRRFYIAEQNGKVLLLMTTIRFLFYIGGIYALVILQIFGLTNILVLFIFSLFLISTLRIKNLVSIFSQYKFYNKFYIRIKNFIISDWKENKYLLSKALIHYFTAQVYILIVGFIIGSSSSATFEVIRIYFSPIVILVMALNNIIIVYLTRLYKQDKLLFFKQMIKILYIWIIFVLMYFTIVYNNLSIIDSFVFNGKYFSKDFEINLIIFSFAVFSSSILPLLGNLFIITNNNQYTFKASLIVFGLNLLFAPLIVSSFGLRGAFIGTSFIQVMLLILNTYYFLKVKKELSL